MWVNNKNMTKIKNSIIFCLFTIISYCQDNTVIVYNAYPTYGSVENDETIKRSKVNYIYNGLDTAIKNVEYELHISTKESYFFFVDKIFKDEKTKILAKTYCGNENFYKNDTLDYKIKEKFFSGKTYFIKDTTNYKWEVFNEQKMIGDVLCFKATTIESKTIKNKITKNIITAWFSPEIPISEGPKGFDGLPGLIMELTNEKVTLVAKNISKDKTILIKKIDLQKVITESSYNKVVKDTRQEFFNDIKTN